MSDDLRPDPAQKQDEDAIRSEHAPRGSLGGDGAPPLLANGVTEEFRAHGRRGRAGSFAATVALIAALAVVAAVAVAVHVGLVGGPRSGDGQTVGLPPGLTADGISCVGSSDCWVIGSSDTGSGGVPASAIWQYAGGNWTTVGISGTGSLAGLVCVTTTDCWAVGSHVTAPQTNHSDATYQPLIEQDTGTGFIPVNEPVASGDANSLAAVTCVTADDCWAVGMYAANSENGGDGIIHPLIEHYDGSAWTVVTSTALPDYGGLNAVTCVDAGECWAVGGISGALIEEFDGTVWTVVSDSNLGTPPGQSGSSLSAVECTGPSSCWAVGSTGQPTTLTASLMQPLVVEYTGAGWTVASSPYVSGPNGAAVTGIACVSADDCWAVGATNPEGSELPAFIGPTPTPSPDPAMYAQTVIEHYDGGSWEVIATQQSGTENEGLSAISCDPSTGTCDAVGALGLEILARDVR